jgi:hypothetical protein
MCFFYLCPDHHISLEDVPAGAGFPSDKEVVLGETIKEILGKRKARYII